MTEDEKLDIARGKEAVRLIAQKYEVIDTEVSLFIGAQAARLARVGWAPVDPDLVRAREIVYGLIEPRTENVLHGHWDRDRTIQAALIAIKWGREHGRS